MMDLEGTEMDETVSMIVVVLLILTGAFGLGVYAAKQEAAVFNKFNQNSAMTATTWDALFSHLRVDACK
jgi:amino acid permease